MSDDQFIEIVEPSKSAGIGRALQSAFSGSYDLPADLCACIDRLSKV